MGGLFGDGTLGAEGGHGDVGASQAGVGRVRATVPSIASLPFDLDLSQKLSSKCKMHSPPPSNVVANVILLSLLPLAARASHNKL